MIFLRSRSCLLFAALVLNLLISSPQALAASRRFYLSASRVQYMPGQMLWSQMTDLTPLKTEADLVNIQLEFYGVPWTVFESTTTPPPDWEWTRLMDNFAAQARSIGKG